MLTFLTGKPGAGKSQLLVKRWIIDIRQDKDPAIAKRPIYTNITGLRVDLIEQRFGGPRVLPAPDDWRDTPEGSLVIYDEAQFLFPATGKPGAPEDPRLIDLAVHRKGGRDIVMATQDPTLVHHWARKFIGQHVHMSRPNNMQAAVVYQWNSYQSDPEDHFAIKGADESRYSYDETIWELYDSATVHTHKFKMPPGSRWAIRAGLCVVVAIAAGLGFLFFKSNGEARAASTGETQHRIAVASAAPASRMEGNSIRIPTPEPLPLSAEFAVLQTAPRVEAINGCVASENRCRCFDFDGHMLDLDQQTCSDFADGTKPLPLDLNRFQNSGSNAQGENPASTPSGPVDFIGSAKEALIGSDAGEGGKSPQGLPPPAAG